jgi:alcohol dehydrogenase class IV
MTGSLSLAAPTCAVPDPAPFRWQDGERLIVFGAGAAGEAGSVLGEGYTLLTTPRARTAAPELVEGAAAVLEVARGRVDELARDLRDRVDGELLVALGGGRVIDVAKALAAADPPRRVAAVPTTLSGADMTAVHRHATGVSADTPRVRPAIVINDPALSASQPLHQLAESAANALGHAVEGPLTSLRHPAAILLAGQGARLLAEGLASPETVDHERLALGSLLCGYVIGTTWYGLHHVLAQTVVRVAGIGHGAANAILLPHTLVALTERFPAELARLGGALGADPLAVARWFAELTGTATLSAAGVERGDIARCVDAAAGRPELALTPPPASPEELSGLLERAF